MRQIPASQGITDYSFGNWIKRRRKTLDMTQQELAQRVGCSISLIFKIESDERRPSRQIAELLAEQLEIPSDQRDLFLKVARQEKTIDGLDSLSPRFDTFGNASLSGTKPASVPHPHHSNLPISPTSLIGREHETDMIVKQLSDPNCRMLTLTGPGGVGKTRLAIEVARQFEAQVSDGVFFLSLAGINSPESIIPILAAELDIVFSGPADPKLQVINHLRKKETLLVFDNFEHLLPGGNLLSEILAQAPKVKLLLTSREQAHLQWEWVFEIQGLPIPDLVNLEALETNSATALFLQRARQASQTFLLSDDEASALVRICKLVDGLPLAIELAASWVRVLSCREIALELEHGLDFLATSLRDMPERHRSIKMVFDHSWELLNDEERAVLMRLSAFSGGFTRQAAEVVAGATLLTLSSLVGKSLLRHNQKTDRYDFHELIRQYSTGRLHAQPAEEAQVLAICSQYFTDWLADLEKPLKSARQIETCLRIRSETVNWNSAWYWAVKHQRFDLLRRMLPCLGWYHEIQGYYAEALSAYRFAVSELRSAGAPDNLSAPQDKSAFAQLLNGLGWFLFRTGNIEQAITLFGESLELARDSTDPTPLFYIHSNWGYLALLNGDSVDAKRLTLESLASAHRLESQWHIAIPITTLGVIEYQQGNFAEAYRQLTESLTIWRTVGDPRGLIFCMLYLSSAALALGKTRIAESILEESNAIAIGKMDRWAYAFGLDLLGQASRSKGQNEEALHLFRQSLAQSQEIGDQWAGTQTLIHVAEAQSALEFKEDAKRLFLEAYANAHQSKWMPTMLEVLVSFILSDAELPADIKLAATLAVLAHPAVSPHVRSRAEKLRMDLETQLTPEQIGDIKMLALNKPVEAFAQEILVTPA
jgi:predicted ATPase/transcriptional regulator with XRE-family HTH domain